MKKKIRIIAVMATITILSLAVNSKAVNISAICLGVQRAVAIQQLELGAGAEETNTPNLTIGESQIAWNEETQSYDMEINVTSENIVDNTSLTVNMEAYREDKTAIESGIDYTISGNTIKNNSATIKINASGEHVTDIYRFIAKITYPTGAETVETKQVRLQTRLLPKVTLGDITVQSENMPENVVQIIKVPVVTEDIPDASNLSVKLVKDGIDVEGANYTVEGNTVTGDVASITINAGPEITVGDYTLIITYTYKNGEIDSTQTAQKTFKITTIEMNKITLNQTELTMEVGENTILSYNIVPSSFTEDDVEFSSENEKVATFTAGGRLTAVGRGETIVKIASKNGKVSATCHVVVLNPSIEITELTTKPETLLQGEDGTINVKIATIDLQNSKRLDLKITKHEIDVTDLFTITGNDVQNNEVNLVITPNKETTTSGEYMLTVTFDGKQIESENIEKQTKKFKIESKTNVTAIKVDQTNIRMTENSTRTVTATLEPEDVQNKKIIWTTNNADVATVDENGTITAVAKGKAVITVCSDENREITASINVTVQEILQTEEYKLDTEKKILKAIPENTTVKMLLENVQIGSDKYSFTDATGKEINEDDLVGTGSTLKINEEEFKLIVAGDVNGDGKISATDLSKLKRHMVELELLTGNNLLGADIDKDDQITLTDLSNMKKYLAGLGI